MNRRLFWMIGGGVVAAHGLFFWFMKDTSSLPKRTYVPPPNFRAREKEFIDPKTGEKIQVQEFTVSTHFDETTRKGADLKMR